MKNVNKKGKANTTKWGLNKIKCLNKKVVWEVCSRVANSLGFSIIAINPIKFNKFLLHIKSKVSEIGEFIVVRKI